MGMHESLAQSHPSIARGQVWCRSCGGTRKVNPADCLRSGWPKCCGYTMTVDSPEVAELERERENSFWRDTTP